MTVANLQSKRSAPAAFTASAASALASIWRRGIPSAAAHSRLPIWTSAVGDPEQGR